GAITNGAIASDNKFVSLDEIRTRGVVNTTGFPITNASVYLPTNTATLNTVSNVMSTDAWYLLRNQRGSVKVQAYSTATLTIATNISLQYSNAATGFISTIDLKNNPAGILATLIETNALELSDFNPDSMVQVATGTIVPNSDLIHYK